MCTFCYERKAKDEYRGFLLRFAFFAVFPNYRKFVCRLLLVLQTLMQSAFISELSINGEELKILNNNKVTVKIYTITIHGIFFSLSIVSLKGIHLYYNFSVVGDM